MQSRERASRWGALFVCALLAGLTFPPLQARECPAGRIDQRAAVASVTDGDTLRLEDGRAVRLIGVNAPELGRDGRPDEPYARKAREALREFLGRESVVGLRLGKERRDRYGRLLAHVYTADGRSLQAWLLGRGLAAQIVVPPNTWGLECYRAAEAEARAAGRGVWDSLYRPVPVAQLPRDIRGFRLIRGRITRVAESRYSVWLNFPLRPGEGRYEGVTLRVPRKDLDNFPRGFLRGLEGREVIARGWIFPHKKQQVMMVRHPAAIEVRPAGARLARLNDPTQTAGAP